MMVSHLVHWADAFSRAKKGKEWPVGTLSCEATGGEKWCVSGFGRGQSTLDESTCGLTWSLFYLVHTGVLGLHADWMTSSLFSWCIRLSLLRAHTGCSKDKWAMIPVARKPQDKKRHFCTKLLLRDGEIGIIHIKSYKIMAKRCYCMLLLCSALTWATRSQVMNFLCFLGFDLSLATPGGLRMGSNWGNAITKCSRKTLHFPNE